MNVDVQIYWDELKTERVVPELALWQAVFLQGISDYMMPKEFIWANVLQPDGTKLRVKTNRMRETPEARTACAWIFNDENTAINSFRGLCGLFGIDVEKARAALKAKKMAGRFRKTGGRRVR